MLQIVWQSPRSEGKPLNRTALYKRANFKSTLEFLVDCFGKILSGQARQALADIAAFIRRLIERRTRLRRAYPRQIKSKRKTYPSACLVQRRKR